MRKTLIGLKRGKLTVIEKIPQPPGSTQSLWKCECECGNFIEAKTDRFCKPSGLKNCGCEKIVTHFTDHTNQKFGKLTAIERLDEKNRFGYYLWRCKCDCGGEKIQGSNYLRISTNQSCGCVKAGRKPIYEDSLKNGLYTNKRAISLKKKIKFSLNREQFSFLIDSNCHYCGDGKTNCRTESYSGKKIFYTGIDRKDPKLGYTLENCVPACRHCNFAKGEQTYEAFLVWLKKISSHLLKE